MAKLQSRTQGARITPLTFLMAQITEAKRLEDGNILHPDKYESPPQEEVPHALACESTESGATRNLVCRCSESEVIGVAGRTSNVEIYKWFTSRTMSIIAGLTAAWQAENAPTLQARRQMASGALTLWAESVAHMEYQKDYVVLQALIEGMGA